MDEAELTGTSMKCTKFILYVFLPLLSAADQQSVYAVRRRAG